jgi:glucuronate isomerase
MSCRDFISASNVEVICTTDDPADSLGAHAALAREGLGFKILPTWRPDRACRLRGGSYPGYLSSLGEAAGVEIRSLGQLFEALTRRLDYFSSLGCRLSDHSFEWIPAPGAADAEDVFAAAVSGGEVTPDEERAFASHVLGFLGKEYAKRGWAMQLHIGALRANNSRMLRLAGADSGFDSVADFPLAAELSAFMDALDEGGALPKTILYHVNPAFNYVLAAMAGNFQCGAPGKIQFGSGWWFCDHYDGMRRQLTDLAALGLLGRFVGMLTDSRSFLSYARHEYFRRVLCELLGEWVDKGHLPRDLDALGDLAEGICYGNAKEYFAF